MAGDYLEERVVEAVLIELKSRAGFDHWWDTLDDEVRQDVTVHLETQVCAVLEEE